MTRQDLRNRQDADHYDRYASQRLGPWDRLMVSRATALRPVVAERTALLIDIGTGTGVIPTLLAAEPAFTSYRFIGYEPFHDMLAKGRDRVGAMGLADRIAIECGDAHALPLEDGSVDMVISRATLHHLSDPSTALREAVRILRPGGVALIHDARRDAPPEVLDLFNAMRAEVGYPPTTLDEKLTLAEVRGLLEKAGLAAQAKVSTGEGLQALGFEILLRKPA